MLKNIALLIIALLYCLTLTSCDGEIVTPVKPPTEKRKLSKLEQIKHDGILHVETRIAPGIYYPTAKGHAGLEYDLATLFAKQLGVKVQFHTAKNLTEVLNKTAKGEVDLAAAGLAVTEVRKTKLHFSNSYLEIVEQVLYRSDSNEPQTPANLNDGILEVPKDSSYIETLEQLRKTSSPQLRWLTNTELDSGGLIALLNQGLIDYTIVDSTQALIIQRYYPQLQIGIDIGQSRHIAWGLPKSPDNSLYDAVNLFIKKIQQDKTLEQLIDRYYGHVEVLNDVGKCKFYEHHQTRLPLYKAYFLTAAQQHNLDWRLLAAIGYQESHWENNSVSPTGVRGLMMLTTNTAQEVGITDRTDPAQSIKGGALYFQQQLNKLPFNIPEPDRTWFALTAYNIGYGHLDDARILTKQKKLNPDKWLDVRESLPLLEEEAWFSKTKYGYARGKEPVVYVENVRNYYDLLVWLSAEKSPQHNQPLYSLKEHIKRAFKSFKYFLTETQKSLAMKMKGSKT